MIKTTKCWYQCVKSVLLLKYTDFSVDVFSMKKVEDGLFLRAVTQQATHEGRSRPIGGRCSDAVFRRFRVEWRR